MTCPTFTKHVVLAVALALVGCATMKYVNPAHSLPDFSSDRVVVLPVAEKLPFDANGILLAVFRSVGHPAAPAPDQADDAVTANAALIHKLSSSGSDVTGHSPRPSLTALLSEQDRADLRKLAGDADHVLVAALFSVRATPMFIRGKASFRLYELASGDLVYQHDAQADAYHDGTVRTGGLIGQADLGRELDASDVDLGKRCVAYLAAIAVAELKETYPAIARR